MSLDEADQPTPIPEGPGATLRAARESKGLSLDDVSERLRYKKHIVGALEVDEYGDDTPLVFIKGYLRAYAELLDLNPDEILAAFATLGLTETRDISEFVNPQKGKNSEMLFKLPLTLDCRPAFLWTGLAAVALSLTGLLWAYVGDGPRAPKTVAEATKATQMQALAAEAGQLEGGKDAEDVTESEGTVAAKPVDTNPHAEALIF